MFELACPWVLSLFPLPLLVWLLIPAAKVYLPPALRVPFFHQLQTFTQHEHRSGLVKERWLLLVLSWCLIVFALAGPRFVGPPRPLARESYNIMLALDVSGSMALRDMVVQGRPITRLAAVKQAARQFVRDRIGDKIGLILFGSQAYLQTPLTYDRHSILMRIDDASVGLAGKTTSIGDALGLAIKRLQAVPTKGRVIILLTDGVNNSGVLAPMKAAELAKAEGIKIYTIGLGASIDPQALGQLFFNMNVMADLDEDTLKAVAKMTGGRYFRASNLSSLQSIYKNINAMERVTQDETSIRPQHDYYPWFLAPALLLLCYWLLERQGYWARFSLILPWRIKEE